MRTDVSRSDKANMARSESGFDVSLFVVVGVAILATLIVRAYGIPLDASFIGLPG